MKLDIFRQFRPKPGSLLPRIFKNFSLSLVGSLILLIVGLARTSLLIKSFTIDAYGNILIIITLFNFLATFFGIRVNDLIYKLYPPFEEANDTASLRGLLLFSTAINIAVGLLISGVIYLLAEFVAQRFYENVSLAQPIRIYAVAALLLSFRSIYTAILRLRDRFALLIIPEVAGALTTLGIIVWYVLNSAEKTIQPIIIAFVIGTVVTVLPPLLIALRMIWPILRQPQGSVYTFWRSNRRELVETLFQTNLVGYLKIASTDGGLFLLGVLTTPTQVALFGTAQQLTRPLQILQNNINTAIVPELVKLAGSGQTFRLYQFARRFSRYALIAGVCGLTGAITISRPLLLLFAKPEYLDALPIFYIILATFLLTFISLPYYPIALSTGKLGRRNIVVAARLLYLGIVISIGLNALNLALVQLAGVLTLRLLFDIPLLYDLRRRAALSS